MMRVEVFRIENHTVQRLFSLVPWSIQRDKIP